jgi:DNA-directed RNA polymerase subunit RPC12/RpoP
MDRIEESIVNQSLKCSNCGKEIMDEWESHDNNEVCDDCYSLPLKKSRGLIIN